MTLGPHAKRRLRVVLLLLPLTGAGLAVWAFLIEPGRLVVNRAELSLGRTPPALRGLKIAAISDIHAGSPHINVEKLNRLVEESNRLQPDLVVLLGDLLLTHNPDVFPDVPARVALTLAGHTHGGQVNLPLVGRPVVPSRYKQLYAYGHVVEGGRHLFVTSGVGTSILPVRFRVPPEITLITITG